MFGIFFGWRKASKCKKLIKRVQCRLKILKNKRYAIARQLREDIGQLLKNGHEETAFNRLEQLYMDESIMSVYEFLDHFCEFIILNISYIRRHKDIPNDINEAISSLIFASARFGDLPELKEIRTLFGERYGHRFVIIAVDLLPGNLVNRQVKENLTVKSIPNQVKNRLLDEIVRDYFFQPGPLALEYKSTPLALEYKPNLQPSEQASQMEALDDKVIEPRPLSIALSPQGSDMISISTSCSIIQQSPSTLTTTTETNDATKYMRSPLSITQRKSPPWSPSSDSSSTFLEESFVYLDDVEEFRSPVKKDTQAQDQRIFVFKSPSMKKMETFLEQMESCHEMSKGKGDSVPQARKRMRRRSISKDRPIINDVECETYYSRPSDHGSRLQRKGQKKINTEFCRCQRSYSLEKPCYFPVNSGENNEIVSMEAQESHAKVQYTAQPRNLKSNRTPPPYSRAMMMPQERATGENTTKGIARTSTFPMEVASGNKVLTSQSHVHPKLPDYEEIAAKFMTLKKVYQQNKCS